MQKKTISKRINTKVEEWIESITDLQLRKDVTDQVIVTGGCITSMFLQEEPNDYDIYFRTMEMTERVANYYVEKFQKQSKTRSDISVIYRDENLNLSNGVGTSSSSSMPYDVYDENFVDHVYLYIGSKGFVKADKKNLIKVPDNGKQHIEKSNQSTKSFDPIFMSSNAITLENNIQLIVRFSGSPQIIHDNFDFAHTKLYWTKEEGVVTNTLSLECIISRRLIYTGSRYPICSIMRSKKFLQRTHDDGKRWTMDVGQYLKMVVQSSKFDLKSPKVLTDQLCGVDTAYFSWVIEECSKPENLLDDVIDLSYLLEVINKVFDSEDSEDWSTDNS